MSAFTVVLFIVGLCLAAGDGEGFPALNFIGVLLMAASGIFHTLFYNERKNRHVR